MGLIRLAVAGALSFALGCSHTQESSESASLVSGKRLKSVDATRSLLVSDSVVLQGFSLHRVLSQIASEADDGATAKSLFVGLFDTQNGGLIGDIDGDGFVGITDLTLIFDLVAVSSIDYAGLVLAIFDNISLSDPPPTPKAGSGPHCDDETTNNRWSFNGFPWQCARNEGDMAFRDPFDSDSDDHVFPIAVVNRFDLADPAGSDCGEYRIVYAKHSHDGLDRLLINVEARMPNPDPSAGLSGCDGIVQFWADMSGQDDPLIRRGLLEEFYFDGIPGYPPVVRANHLGGDLGQVRINGFMVATAVTTWNLREFKLAQAPTMAFLPTTDKGNPDPSLFAEANGDPRVLAFQDAFVSDLDTLLGDDPNLWAITTPDAFNSGQSVANDQVITAMSTGQPNDYLRYVVPGGAFETSITNGLAARGSALTAANVINRATSSSCGGCHRHASNRDMGSDVLGPTSLGFVHISEEFPEPSPLGTGVRYRISPALTDVYLPHRSSQLLDFLSGSRPEERRKPDLRVNSTTAGFQPRPN